MGESEMNAPALTAKFLPFPPIIGTFDQGPWRGFFVTLVAWRTSADARWRNESDSGIVCECNVK